MTTASEASFLITACPAHGTKETGDRASFVMYVENALTERNLRILGELDTDAYVAEGWDYWECCPKMVIDPYGILDH